MRVSSANSGQSFGSIQKLIYVTGDMKKTCLFSPLRKGEGLPKKVGEFITRQNGDVSGYRYFHNGVKINYGMTKTPNGPCVSYTFTQPPGKDKPARVFFLFGLDSFKENFKQLTSLSGIKQYIKKIKDAPKKTKYKPCS